MKQKEVVINSGQLMLTDITSSSGSATFHCEQKFDKNHPRQKAITDAVVSTSSFTLDLSILALSL